MLAYILGAKYIDLHQPDSKPTFHKETLGLIQGNLPHHSEYEAVCKSHSRFSYFSDVLGLDSFDKVLHIVRDPRDVTVSYYFYWYDNLPIARNEPEKVLSRRPWVIRKYYWKKTVYKVAREWSLHTLSWRHYEGAKLFRYEDLYADSLAVLVKICDYLEHPCPPSLLGDAIDLFRFERLSGGRHAGDELATAFFRKGVIGDFRNHFDLADTIIMRHLARREMRELDYDI